ncbi:tRNA(Arg) A34 adenosine deaminase TadA [Nocardioides terrae]|uniref:tRNA(Arg) A34 adenosine deaminase TadA n=1 Tax=Nocardioides terrae TaxID=574651 RepID=A0A1I1DYE5_9ACTN|nr:nucleoside deaminase [Nocardioides terrae]SFB79955.1 tRNA(Arg) A34 adenosine deaminase TadA [Nocardioides terrae]
MTENVDSVHLRRCVTLAVEALEAGDDPFGSVLVDSDGDLLAEARNLEHTESDPTAHPELALARWAIAHLPVAERAATTVYTSGEHCPMCAAAHGWAGLGRVVYAASAEQLSGWRTGWGLSGSPVRPLAITDVAPGLEVVGPVAPYDEEMRAVHERALDR